MIGMSIVPGEPVSNMGKEKEEMQEKLVEKTNVINKIEQFKSEDSRTDIQRIYDKNDQTGKKLISTILNYYDELKQNMDESEIVNMI